jgi:Rod binding domain-containing protein
VSLPAASAAAGLPVVNQALEPKWVRDGSAATQKAYDSALSFEQTLVEQLSQSLTATSGLGGESSQERESSSEAGGAGGSSSANDSELSSLLPQALSSGVMSAGGLGLAAQMTRELEGVHSAAQTHASGGTAPAANAAPTAPTAAPAVGDATNGGTGA